jgi:hypothetical protein
MITEREVALRLAANGDVDRKLRVSSTSRFFWFYSLSLWDPDAFEQCVAGAAGFAAMAFLLTSLTFVGLERPSMVATSMFEYFLLGLIFMWFYSLGPWLQPTNLKVILTFVFRLYRKGKVLGDLSAEEISRLFPRRRDGQISTLKEHSNRSRISALIEMIEGSAAFGSLTVGALTVGALFAFFLVALLVMASFLGSL